MAKGEGFEPSSQGFGDLYTTIVLAQYLESADRLALSHKSFADFHITIFAMLTLVRRERLALPEPSDT